MAIRLLRTNRYPTYQFYGEMANLSTKARDGLKIAALTCLSWLRKRLEGNAIPEVIRMAEPEDYPKVKEEDFDSFNLSDDYIIDVVSDFKEGIWALRIIENDRGALSKDHPVPGRSIESDVAFRIVNDVLQCGFKTIVSDTADVEKAACVRFSLIKALCFNDAFGLKQITRIFDPDHMDIGNREKLDELLSLFRNNENQLPFLFYSYEDYSDQDPSRPGLNVDVNSLRKLHKESLDRKVFNKANPYANRYAGIARAYFLPKRLFEEFRKTFSVGTFEAGDVIVLDPRHFGGRCRIFSYEDKEAYRSYVTNFSRDRKMDFKNVLFVEEAKILADRKKEDYVSSLLMRIEQTGRDLETVRSQIAREERLNAYQKENPELKRKLEETLDALERSENINLVLSRELERAKVQEENRDRYIQYLERKLKRPDKHNKIAEWTSSYSYVVLDKKAIDCLDRRDAENVDLDVICDSLDYLEYLYSQFLFEEMEVGELNDLSSLIYHRPFEVSPSGIPVSARGECKVRYAFGDGVKREYPLDWHLKAGNHGELIRVYFIIDKERKKMIVGSLPNHLVY